VALLTGLREGYAKFCCFSCEWDSRARDRHYHVKQWPLRGETILGQKNVAHRNLVNKTKVYLPLHHIQLGLIKIFVQTMNKAGEGFDYLRQTFPRKSEAKIKEGIFVGPQVKQLFQTMNKAGEGFDYLRQTFPRKSEAKIKEDIFVGSQVKQLFQDLYFKNKFNAANRRACDAFENVCSNFL
jgi:hypothetical protein